MRRVEPTVRSRSAPISAARRELRIGGQALAQPPQVHLERGQKLAELVVQLARDVRLLLLARLEHAHRELAQLALRSLERVLELLAPRDVAQDHGVVASARRAGLRDRGLDRELLALIFLDVVRSAQSVVTSPMRRLVTPVLPKCWMCLRFAKARRQEAVERGADASSRRTRNICSAARLKSTIFCLSSTETIASIAESTIEPSCASPRCGARRPALRRRRPRSRRRSPACRRRSRLRAATASRARAGRPPRSRPRGRRAQPRPPRSRPDGGSSFV